MNYAYDTYIMHREAYKEWGGAVQHELGRLDVDQVGTLVQEFGRSDVNYVRTLISANGLKKWNQKV